eukprot:scaffold15176_cov102-Isochrysis_galbana.AAC.2
MVGPSWPHIACMCLQDSSRPRKGSGKAPAQWSTSLGTRGVGFFSGPLAVPSLPRRQVLGKCACFCAEGIGSPKTRWRTCHEIDNLDSSSGVVKPDTE